LAVCSALSATTVRAQQGSSGRTVDQSPADVAIARGRLDDAESILFAASERAPHEPSARGALGGYLASRGHLKVGAVLLEEARKFGGDAAVIDARLARVYPWIGDWGAVAALQRDPESAVERARAKWLANHLPQHSGADSVVLALEPNDIAGLGRITITIGRATVVADVDPNVEGLVLPATPGIGADAQLFGMHDSATVAVMRTVGIGALTLTNVRARLAPGAQPLIGLDVIAVLAPTFDAGRRQLTLHQRAVALSGTPLPILLSFPGVQLVTRPAQPPVAIESPAGRAALRGSPWTLDLKSGSVVVQR
jgi:hypothetical protein